MRFSTANDEYWQNIALPMIESARKKLRDLIIDHLVAKGMMNPKQVFEPRLSDLYDQGVAGILAKNAEKVIGLIERINANVFLSR